MSSWCFSLLILIAIFFPTPSVADSSYTVRLTNGNVIEVNSYTFKDGKVYLKYPVGEAAIPAMQVVSIKATDGNMELLQTEGVSVPHAEPKTLNTGKPVSSPGSVAADQHQIQPGKGVPNSPGTPYRETMRQSAPGSDHSQKTVSISKSIYRGPMATNCDYDPVVDALVERLSTADEKQTEEIEKQLNAIFNDDETAN